MCGHGCTGEIRTHDLSDPGDGPGQKTLKAQGQSWENGEYTCIHHKADSVIRVSDCAASQQQTLNSSAHLVLIRFLSAAEESEKPPLYCQILLDIHYCLCIPH